MSNSQTRKVAMPLLRRLRLMRQRFLPFVVWCVALSSAAVLWKRSAVRVDAVGSVELREIAVAPLIDGTIQTMSVDWFDQVEADKVVALMDDTLVKAELITAQAELSQLRATLDAERDKLQLLATDRQLDEHNMRRRFILNEEEARLDYIDRVSRQETNKLTVERLKIQLDRQKLLFDKNITDQATYDDTRLRHESVKTELEENEKAIELAAARIDEAMQRRKEHEQQMTDVDTPALMQPLIENIRVQENRIAQIGERRKLLVLKAPLAGKVSRIFHRTGETVLSGDPLLSITDARSERVLAYVDEGTVHNIRIGDNVVVSSRDHPKRYASAKILRVNSKIEEFPIRLRQNPYLPQWGLSILVGNIPGDRFYPGEVLHLRIEPSSEDS